MEQYISKSALVAEIEKRRNEYINSLMTEQVHILSDMLDFINTLEVKEVDLKKEISFQWSKFCLSSKDRGSFVKVAEHFFELALSLKNN